MSPRPYAPGDRVGGGCKTGTVTLTGPAEVRTTAAEVLDAVAEGERPDVDGAEVLLGAAGADFERMLVLASRLRDEGLERAGHPGVITYSRKAFVPLTTLCRDRCHYCAFVDTPGQLQRLRKPAYMSPERVMDVVRNAQRMGCKEALITLGERPEDRWPQAREWLDEHGFATTLEYVAATARMITAETGMLAHLNPGAMSYDELVMLRPTAPSMGMMLETTSRALFEEPGGAHYGSPDKDPVVRLRAIDDAGRAGVPFTTGILVGIGETLRDRAESLVAIRDANDRHGHVQEVIVQNFRAKPGTAMRDAPDADPREYLAAIAVARLVLGPDMRIQVPPNLSDPSQFAAFVRAGIDDWGGVSPLTADHVNPERPWPRIDRLAARTAELGFELRERLTAHPRFVRDPERWLDAALRAPVAALADPETGLARPGVVASPPAPERAKRDEGAHHGIPHLAETAASDPLTLDDGEWIRLLSATGADLDALTATANDLRRYTVGEAVSIVVNRNLTTTGLRAAPDDDPATFTLDDVAAIARDAADLGATELCIQGRISADLPPDLYVDVVRAVKHAAPALHVHAYRPHDVADFADRSGLDLDTALGVLRDAGVGTIPGTGLKVLSERVRRLVAPADLPVDRWVEVVTAAHDAGLSSSSVLFYGHVETAAERVMHVRMLRHIQDETEGFTEFVPIPLPGPAGGVPLVAGRSALDEQRAMTAVSRLMLTGSIPHIQIPWPRVGREAAAVLLQSGGDDLGGTLLDGRVKPQAGVEVGRELPLADAASMARHLLRAFRQRTTDYRQVTT